MGKKRRIIKFPLKFGRKFSAHPRIKFLKKSEKAIEESKPEFEPIISVHEEEKPIKKTTPTKRKAVAKKKRTVRSKPKRTAKAISKK